MRPLPKRLRNRRNKANIKGLQKGAVRWRNINGTFLLCTLALHARFARLLHMRSPGFHGME